MMYSYSDIIAKTKASADWMVANIAAISDFRRVSDDIGDLVDDINYPLCVVFMDQVNFDDVEAGRAYISVFIKNKGSKILGNIELTKKILDILQNISCGGNCTSSMPTQITNDIDTRSGARVEIKNIITRIEIEVQI